MTPKPELRENKNTDSVAVGVIEAIGQLADDELFVSGWSRRRPPPGATVLVTGNGQSVEGRIWTAWSDRPDVGPGAGFAGVIELAGPAKAADLHGIQLGNAHNLTLYDACTFLDRPQAIRLLRTGLPSAFVEGQRQRLERVAARFDGTDTISTSTQPIRVGIDDCVALPGASVLVSGWLFDPEEAIDAVWVGGDTASSRIDHTWVTQNRPDVAASFAADPRFALYQPAHAVHGFVAIASSIAIESPWRLTLVTKEGAELHVPLAARQGAPLALLRGFLERLDPDVPATLDVADHLIAPVLAALEQHGPQLLRHTLEQSHAQAAVTLVIGCCGDGADLPMLLASLAADPAVRAVPLIVAADTRELASLEGQLGRAAKSFGLSLGFAHGHGIADHLDALSVGIKAATSPTVCLLAADRLPYHRGWLTKLLSVKSEAPGAAILPALFDGLGLSLHPDQRQRARRTSDLACCLIDRAIFLDCGGFAANRLDRASKSQVLLDRLSAAGVVTRIVETAEILITARPTPSVRLARRADARVAQIQLLSP